MRSVITGHYLLFGAFEPSDQILEIEFPPSLGVHLIGEDSFENQINELEQAFVEEITTIWKSAAEIECPLVSVNTIKASNVNKDKSEVFPSFYPDFKQKWYPIQSVLTMNHEVTRDLEFDHLYILEMIEKFSISPNQCNKCNNLSKVFMNPEYYHNNLYIKNSSWKLNDG